MGFLEKLKNTFFEEEYVEVPEKAKEEKNKKTTPIFTKIEEEKRVQKIEEKPEKEQEIATKIESIEPNEETQKRETKFNYFDDDDFLDDTYNEPEYREEVNIPSTKIEEPHTYENTVYGSKKNLVNRGISQPIYQKEEKTKFKPTPVISPIYGILDKNYTKDDIIETKEIKPTSSYVSRKNVDLDSIRQKAFGFIDDEIEEDKEENIGDSIKNDIEVDNFENYDDDDDEDKMDGGLLYDMTDIDKTPSVDKVTLQDAEEYFEDLGLEYNVDYKDAKLEKKTGRRVNRAPKLEEIEEEKEDDFEETTSLMEENFKATEDEDDTSSVEDNLFDLIDSMYEDKE